MCYTAWVPVIAGLIGGVTGISGSIALEWYRNQRTTKLDTKRGEYLLTMLKDEKRNWRELRTLSHVIGADEETTKRLLIEIGARASENGEPKWALISRKPFPKGQ